jgi:predicted nucleic acid-binding Zn ribbon protein
MVKHINCIIDEVRKKILRENTKKVAAISTNWDKIVDPQIARRTQVIGIKQKVLYVKVESPSLLSELSNFKKNTVLEKLQFKYSNHQIRDIKFVI